jgi:hypothetical protein
MSEIRNNYLFKNPENSVLYILKPLKNKRKGLKKARIVPLLVLVGGAGSSAKKSSRLIQFNFNLLATPHHSPS